MGILASETPPGKSQAGTAPGMSPPAQHGCHVCADQRVVVFAWLLRAIDLADVVAMRRETQELRKLGFSVVMTANGGQR